MLSEKVHKLKKKNEHLFLNPMFSKNHLIPLSLFVGQGRRNQDSQQLILLLLMFSIAII